MRIFETLKEPIPNGLPSAQAHGNDIILCDFDGTISVEDTTDVLLQHFGTGDFEALEAQWLAGQIGSRACMRGQISLLDASPEELNACLDGIHIDPGFAAFVTAARQQAMEVQVVSDGLDHAIGRILQRHGLDFLPVWANRLVRDGARRWRLEFPHASASCPKDNGNCKCAQLRRQHERGGAIIYVGDGASDYCAAAKADMVLAKGKLLEHCRQNAIAHCPIRNFADAQQWLAQRAARERAAARIHA